jgi:hypothetical protein
MRCSSCAWDNRDGAKRCSGCGSPLMEAGTGYQSPAAAGNAAPGGKGNNLPTVAEVLPQSLGRGNFLPTVPEGSAGHMHHGVAGAGLSPAPARGTVLSSEVSRDIAGWLVVLRSRLMSPYTEIPIFSGRNVLGRANTPDLRQRVSDDGVSEQHSLIVAEPGRVQITDMGSSNGTWVNSQRTPGAVLKKGDQVRLGKTTFVFIPMPGF